MTHSGSASTSLMHGLRRIALLAVLLSLFAPWFRFHDGGTFIGWQTVWMSLLLGDWTPIHLVLLLMTLSLAAATAVALGGRWTKGLARWQPVFLAVALAGIVAFALAWGPWRGEGTSGVLWGLWAGAACLVAGLAVEVVARVEARN